MCQPLFWFLGTFCDTMTTLKGYMHAKSTSEASLNITLCSILFFPNRRTLQVYRVLLILSHGEYAIACLKINNNGFYPTHPVLITLVGHSWQAGLYIQFSQIFQRAVRDSLKTELRQMGEDFWQHHKNCEREGGGVDSD